jgi:hypothetical protein
MTIKCFTVATHIDGYYDILLQSCKRNNINIHVLGKGEKYINHLFKTYKTIEFLKKQKSDQIVLFIDGFDSIVLENINIIEKKFLKLKVPFIFSEDIKYNYYKNLALKFFIKINSTNNYIFNNLLTISRPCFLDNEYKYINSGLFIGYSKYLLKIFENSIKFVKYYNHNSNQRLLQDMCNQKTKMFVDSKNIIFYNFSSRDNVKLKNKKIYINNKKSCIISKPGLGDLSKIAVYLDYDISFIKKRNLLLYYLGGSNKRTVIFVFIVNILFLLLFIKISKMYYMKYSLNSK